MNATTHTHTHRHTHAHTHTHTHTHSQTQNSPEWSAEQKCWLRIVFVRAALTKSLTGYELEAEREKVEPFSDRSLFTRLVKKYPETHTQKKNTHKNNQAPHNDGFFSTETAGERLNRVHHGSEKETSLTRAAANLALSGFRTHPAR